MGLGTKIGLTLVLVVIGAIIFGVIGDLFGHGHYLVTGVEVVMLWYIWTRNSTNSTNSMEPFFGPRKNGPRKNIASNLNSRDMIRADSRYLRPLFMVGAIVMVVWIVIVITASGVFVWSKKENGKGTSSRVNLICYYFNGFQVEQRTYVYDVRDIAFKLPPAHRYKSILRRSCPLIRR